MVATKPINCKWCGQPCMDYRKGYLAKFKPCACPGRWMRSHKKRIGSLVTDVNGLEFKVVRIHKGFWGRGPKGQTYRYSLARSYEPVRYVTYYVLRKFYKDA
jgi:hypothetical protein